MEESEGEGRTVSNISRGLFRLRDPNLRWERGKNERGLFRRKQSSKRVPLVDDDDEEGGGVRRAK